LDVYYPQIAAGVTATEVKGSVGAGPFKAEVGRKYEVSETDHARLEAVLKALEADRAIGSVAEPRQFFRGRLSARCLIHSQSALFAGYVRTSDSETCVGLACSLQNMIGYSVRELPNCSERHVGPLSAEYFVPNSSSLAFGWMLRKIWAPNDLLSNVGGDIQKYVRARNVSYELASSEQKLADDLAFLNSLILYVHPPGFLEHVFREIVLAPFVDPCLRLIRGRDWYHEKVETLRKQARLSRVDVPSVLEREDAETLNAVASAASNIDAPARNYEYVALRLLDGDVQGGRVLFGSPLYIAAIY
jgi:hypothetical protein